MLYVLDIYTLTLIRLHLLCTLHLTPPLLLHLLYSASSLTSRHIHFFFSPPDLISVSSCYCIRVRILVHTDTSAYVLLVHTCPHATAYVWGY